MEVLVLVGLVAVIILTVIVIYNNIIKRMNAVARAWTDVVVQERQKNNVLPSLEKIASGYEEYEATIMTQITRLRADLKRLDANNMDFSALSDTRSHTTALLNGLYAVAENYPALKASDLYRGLMAEISEQHQNISAAIRIFNSNVEDFNNGIEMFPHSLVNSLFNKKHKLATFKDTQAESSFEYRPDIH
ncbi:LemA family protein [Salmonella enterica]|nr:LemA family protein [Salmonella enterica]EHK3167092.1 LemA family protein [Salmonella enterica subsp. enterica serovar Urbana]EGL6552071.1 LemA family protein [Salmonella enterica]EGS1593958.1 LemA family protein [Salmonella enterica]EGS1594091.1 LemA family protein [Salmonella enterica]